MYSIHHRMENIQPMIENPPQFTRHISDPHAMEIELVGGGPLDGTTWNITDPSEATDGGYLIVPGPAGETDDGRDLRAHYEPLPGDVATRWHYLGMVEA